MSETDTDLKRQRPYRQCPECDYVEQARRTTVVSRQRRWGARTKVAGELRWAADFCPRDGNRLIEQCDSCSSRLLAPDDPCCGACGKHYWWRVEDGSTEARLEDWEVDDNRIERFGELGVYCVRSSIVNVVADALVSCDDTTGAMRSRSAARLKSTGGDEIEAESMARRHELGDAWLTGSGRLDARHVLHLAILGTSEGTTEDVLRQALAAGLRTAEDHGLETLALPALGVGRSRFPLAGSAALSYDVLRSHEATRQRSTLRAVAFVLHQPEERSAFRLAFEQHRDSL